MTEKLRGDFPLQYFHKFFLPPTFCLLCLLSEAKVRPYLSGSHLGMWESKEMMCIPNPNNRLFFEHHPDVRLGPLRELYDYGGASGPAIL